MTNWNPALLKNSKKIPSPLRDTLFRIALSFRNKPYPIILTLKHLSIRCGVPYYLLRCFIQNQRYNYHIYKIKKHDGGFRIICAPSPYLLKVQRWINKYILAEMAKSITHSYAYIPHKSTKDCAIPHLCAEWLLKIDIKNYFDSISEINVYNYFRKLGYSKLVSFELARICTIPYHERSKSAKKSKFIVWKNKRYKFLKSKQIGHLPQGAATSPLLANLITQNIDFQINKALVEYNETLVYTRYADDIFISTMDNCFVMHDMKKILSIVTNILQINHFEINSKKIRIFKPGTRKIILGIVINDKTCHLSKEFKSKLECHLYYCSKDIVLHKNRRKFDSIFGLLAYLNGLISYAKFVEPDYINKLIRKGLIPKEGKFSLDL